jgi:hypothetical protein
MTGTSDAAGIQSKMNSNRVVILLSPFVFVA